MKPEFRWLSMLRKVEDNGCGKSGNSSGATGTVGNF